VVKTTNGLANIMPLPKPFLPAARQGLNIFHDIKNFKGHQIQRQAAEGCQISQYLDDSSHNLDAN
jgi:hypothetical protein